MRVRFAPSPTGNLHIGSVRTALFNWLYARHHKAALILRIEDTDLQRSTKNYEQNILDGLSWLGLDYDEGPNKEGAFGPYRQSERISKDMYKPFADTLLESGHAYRCFCTGEMLDNERQDAQQKGIAYKYSKRCLNLSDQEIFDRLEKGLPFTYRIQVPDKKVTFNDLVRENIEFDLGLLSDFIIVKSDGTPSYNFAVVVDDLLMDITHVIRGEDHISNTPKQMIIFEALDKPMPKFAHIPIILGPDRSKLSKRHGATAVTDYQKEGYLPDAMLNFLSLLGWSPPDEKEIMAKDEIVSKFSLDRVSKSGAIFDSTKCKWMNGQYIRALSNDQLYKMAWPYLNSDKKAAIEHIYDNTAQLRLLQAIKDNLSVLSDINNYVDVFIQTQDEFRQKIQALSLSADQMTIYNAFKAKLNQLSNDLDDQGFKDLLSDIIKEQNAPLGKVYKTTRLICTGDSSGPNLMTTLSLLGKETLISRLEIIGTALL